MQMLQMLTDHVPLLVDHHAQVLKDVIYVCDVRLRKIRKEFRFSVSLMFVV